MPVTLKLSMSWLSLYTQCPPYHKLDFQLKELPPLRPNPIHSLFVCLIKALKSGLAWLVFLFFFLNTTDLGDRDDMRTGRESGAER